MGSQFRKKYKKWDKNLDKKSPKMGSKFRQKISKKWDQNLEKKVSKNGIQI